MTSRLFALIIGGSALAFSGAFALAEDCTIVNMQNSSAMAKYNAAWKEFNASFARDIPALRAHAKQMYASWSKLGTRSTVAFKKAMQALADGEYEGDKPANFLSRKVEEDLNALGKNKDFVAGFFPDVKDESQRRKNWNTLDIRVTAAIRGDGTFNVNEDGEPQFTICMDEVKPTKEGMSFICGIVTRFDSPGEKKFIDDYIDNVRSSRVINGSPDLQKPYLVQCPASGETGAVPPKADGETDSAKQADKSDNDTNYVAPRTWGGTSDPK